MYFKKFYITEIPSDLCVTLMEKFKGNNYKILRNSKLKRASLLNYCFSVENMNANAITHIHNLLQKQFPQIYVLL